jgi:hypothetical protein
VDKFNVIAKSDNVNVGKSVFYGIGKLKIILQPFDNILTIIIAQDVSIEQTPGINSLGNLALVKAPQYLDMTNMGEINFVIKNDVLKFETSLYTLSEAIDLSRGQLVFRVPESSMKDIKRIFDSGQNIFYITSKLNAQTSVVYSGLFGIFDSQSNIDTINEQQIEVEKEVLSAEKSQVLIDTYSQNTAIVYRRRLSGNTTTPGTNGTQSGTLSFSSVSVTIKLGGVTYTVSASSSLIIDGFEWTTAQIKEVLLLNNNPLNLTILTDGLYSNGQFLDRLVDLSSKLISKYLTKPEDITNYNQVTKTFRDTQLALEQQQAQSEGEGE